MKEFEVYGRTDEFQRGIQEVIFQAKLVSESMMKRAQNIWEERNGHFQYIEKFARSLYNSVKEYAESGNLAELELEYPVDTPETMTIVAEELQKNFDIPLTLSDNSTLPQRTAVPTKIDGIQLLTIVPKPQSTSGLLINVLGAKALQRALAIT